MADFEILVADDASEDGTLAMLMDSARLDPRIKVIKRASAWGLTRNLNALIGAARGEFIARLDHDDVCEPTRLEQQVAFLRAHPDHDAVGTWARCLDESGNAGELLRMPVSDSDIRRGLEISNCVIHPSVMIRRSALERLGGYDESITYAQDYDLWLRLVESGKIANLPEPLLRYRIHSGQISAAKLVAQSMFAHRALQAAYVRRLRRGGTWGPVIAAQMCYRSLRGRPGTYAYLLGEHAVRYFASGDRTRGWGLWARSACHGPLRWHPWRLLVSALKQKWGADWERGR